MSILSPQTIRRMVLSGEMEIYPFVDQWPQAKENGRSYGLTCDGYDIRIAETVRVWPGVGKISYAVERIMLPHYVRAKIDNKSTNARLFIDASRSTNADPGFFGTLTLEITRERMWPITILAGTPIAKLVFETLDEPTCYPYSGKYQGQEARAYRAIMEK